MTSVSVEEVRTKLANLVLSAILKASFASIESNIEGGYFFNLLIDFDFKFQDYLNRQTKKLRYVNFFEMNYKNCQKILKIKVLLDSLRNK